MARHFTQVGLLNVVQIFVCRRRQPFTHFFIGQDLMLQDAHLRQRFTARRCRLAASWRIMSQLAMEERCESGEALEGAGELLIVIVFMKSSCLNQPMTKN